MCKLMNWIELFTLPPNFYYRLWWVLLVRVTCYYYYFFKPFWKSLPKQIIQHKCCIFIYHVISLKGIFSDANNIFFLLKWIWSCYKASTKVTRTSSFLPIKWKLSYFMTDQVASALREFFFLQFATKFAPKQQRLARIGTILWLLMCFKFRKFDIPHGGTKMQSVTCTA